MSQQLEIETLLASFPAGSAVVLHGDYQVRNLSLPPGIRLIGQDQLTFRLAPGVGPARCLVGTTGTYHLEGVHLLGDGSSHVGTPLQHHGLAIIGADAVTLVDVVASGWWGDGVYVGTDSERPIPHLEVTRGRFEDNARHGLTCQGSFHVRASTARNNQSSGFHVEPDAGDHRSRSGGLLASFVSSGNARGFSIAGQGASGGHHLSPVVRGSSSPDGGLFSGVHDAQATDVSGPIEVGAQAYRVSVRAGSGDVTIGGWAQAPPEDVVIEARSVPTLTIRRGYTGSEWAPPLRTRLIDCSIQISDIHPDVVLL